MMKNNKLIINNNQAGTEANNTRPTVRGVTSANYRQQAKTVAYNYAATPAAAAVVVAVAAEKTAEGALRTS